MKIVLAAVLALAVAGPALASDEPPPSRALTCVTIPQIYIGSVPVNQAAEICVPTP